MESMSLTLILILNFDHMVSDTFKSTRRKVLIIGGTKFKSDMSTNIPHQPDSKKQNALLQYED